MQKTKGYPLGKTIKRMLANLNKNDKSIYVYFIFFTITTAAYPFFSVVLPKLLIGELELGKQASLEKIFYIVIGYFVVAALFNFIKILTSNYASPKINLLRMNYIRDMTDKMLSFEYKYCEDATFSDDHSKAFQSISSNDNGIEGVYRQLFNTPAILITAIALIIFVGRLNILILLGMLLNLAITLIVNKGVQNYNYSRKKDLAHAERRSSYYYSTTHDFAFGKDIRVYSFKDRILSNYNKEIEGYIAVNKKIKNKEYGLGFIALLTLLISDAITYGILIYKTVNGMSIADFSMYLVAITSLSLLLKTLAENITAIFVEGQYVDEFYRFMDEDLGEMGGDVQAIKDDTLEIEFKNVSFKYPRTDNYIVKNLNLKIKKGERLAIVGINGAGKTTIVKLITGLFAPTEGKILINNVPIEKYNKKALHSMFSVVFQDVNIIAYTIKENVACTSVDADEEKVKEALDRVGLLKKVMGFEKGLDQMMLKVVDENGTDFSGGEKQKLAIARALYKDANMVIMDEPTAALDALAEAEIYENFSDLVHGKTAIYISHRLASTKFCDKIALFDNNGLKEYGNHEELMKLQGKYYEMFTVQGKYYVEGAELANE